MRACDFFDNAIFPSGLALPEVLAVTGLTRSQFNLWHERRRLPGDLFKLSPGGWRRYGLQQVWVLLWLRVLTAAGISVEEAVPLARRFDFNARLLLLLGFYLPSHDGEPLCAQFGDRTAADLRRDRENGLGIFAPDLGFDLWIDCLEKKGLCTEEIEEARSARNEAIKNAVASTLVCRRPRNLDAVRSPMLYLAEVWVMLPISYDATADGIRRWMRSEDIEISMIVDHLSVVVDGLIKLEKVLADRS